MSIRFQTLVDSAMLVVATIYLVYPPWRQPPMQLALALLIVVSLAIFTWRLHVSGILRMTPRQIMESTERPRTSWLSTMAVMAAVIALVVSSLR